MWIGRREFLAIGGTGLSVLLGGEAQAAGDYPNHPVRVIVPFPPGGGTDVLARLLGQRLSQRLGQPFVIDNRPGAGGNLGTEVVVRSPPDGYTLLFVTTNNAISATLFDNLNFNFIQDIAPVAAVLRFPNVMEVNPAFPAKSVPEFIAYAKANPGKINMASAGNGGAPHVAGELFKLMAGVDMIHVPYRGAAQALNDLIAGHVQVMFGTLPESIEHIRAGRLRALAVTTTNRSDLLPDIPTVSDFVPGYEASAWQGIGAPKATPPNIIELLNRETNAALMDPHISQYLSDLGGVLLPGSPAEFAALIASETEKWGKVVKFSGAKPD